MPHGKLTVIVDSASGIKEPSKHGSGDSYCTLQCGNQVLSTHVAEGAGSHPTFQTEFEFEIDRSTNDLFISVYSAGSKGDDELVGSTTLDFKTIFFHGHTVPLTAYPLLRLSGRAGGHISVSLQFKARPSPYAHNPHGPVRRNSAPLPTRPHHNIQHHEYETSYEDGYGSSGSSESSKRSGDLPYRRSQSQPEPYHEDLESPRADALDYQPGSYEDYEHQRRSQQSAHHAQPRHHHASPSAHQAMPNVPNRPHRAITVKRGTAGPLQAVQRVQYQPQQGMQYQPQQEMQYHPQQGQPQQRMQGQPRQGMQGQPQHRMQGQPQQRMQGQPQHRMQGQPQQRMQGQPQHRMQGQPQQRMQGQPQQRMQGQPQQRMQGQPRQRMQGQPRQRMQGQPPQGQMQQGGMMAQAAEQVAQAMAVEVASQSVQALAGGIGDMLGGLFG